MGRDQPEETAAPPLTARRKTPLAQCLIGDLAKKRYAIAFERLLQDWSSPECVPRTLLHVDEAVASHIERLWAAGEGYNAAADVLSAIGFYLPPASAYLRYSRKLLKKWKIEEPPAQAAPLSPQVVLGLAGLAAALGMADVAALLLAGFDGILRSQDLFQLRVRDVHIVGQGAVLRLEQTKTAVRHGGKEIATLRGQLARRWLRQAMANREPQDLVLCRPKQHFRDIFKALLTFFGINDGRLQLYSLRRGGASWDFLQHGQIDRTLDRGRWQHAKTAKVYVQTAVAEAADLALSAQCEADLKYFAQYLLNI